jgi:glycosyltransferase involved in cell wall biosynthesis
MSSAPKISLIVSCYNQQPWLSHLLASVHGQRIDVPFEVLVCDDGSTDAGFEQVRAALATSALDLRYIWQPHHGFRVSRSRNNGIRCARGVVLAFVDADSWLAPTFLSDHWRAHQQCSALVCGMRQTVDATLAELAGLAPGDLLSRRNELQREHREQKQWIRSNVPWMACLGSNFSVPASAAVEFDERFTSWGSEDRDVAIRLFRSGLSVVLLSTPNVVHFGLRGDLTGFGGHDEVVAFIRNKLYLHSKYPEGEMRRSIELVKYCHLDSQTNRWCPGPLRYEVSAETVFEEFRVWAEKQDSGSQPTHDALAVRGAW